MMAHTPLITIGLPIYNAEHTLAEAIQSILDQSFSDWELLLLDDGSSDASSVIARQFTDRRIHFVSDGENKGISFRLNQAVALGRGGYFCRMDADDLSFPDRLQKQLDFMEAHRNVDLVAASIVTFDDGILKGIVRVPANHDEICRRPWNGFYFPHPTWFGRMEWFRQNAYSSAANGAEDQFLLYKTYQDSILAGLPDVLLCYRDERRSFKKMFGRRKRFWRVIGAGALEKGRFLDLFLLCAFQPMKMVADFLHIKMGVSSMRNQLRPIDASVVETWNKMTSQSDRKTP